ncbi:MAG: gliding motility-associated C-terminal domain-containing protein [Flavobacteriales bacterium]
MAYRVNIYLFFLLLGLVQGNLWGQTPSISINPGNDTTLCIGQVLPLTATVNGTGPGTSNYTVENIPFAPESNLGTTISLSDDAISNVLPIGFTFCFFDNQYTQFYISSNGWIGFSAGQPTTFTTATIPSTAGTVPKNCIMGPWQDWHPGVGGTIRYQTIGTAPNRKLVVSYINVPLFSCTTLFGTFQIVLNEGSNIIENHITSKPGTCSWASGTAVQGIHNLAGTVAVVVPGRNSTVWASNNQSVRYVPFGNSTPTVTWTINGINAGSGPNINAFVTNGNPNRQYVARAQFGCSNLIIYDTVNVTLGNASADFTVTSPICLSGQNSTITYTGNASANATFTWNFDGGTIVSGSGQGPYQVSWATPGTKNVTLTVTTAGCQPGTFSQQVEVIPLPTSTFTIPNQTCQSQNTTIQYTGNATGGNFNWNFGGGTVVSGTGAGPYEISWDTPGSKTITLTVTVGGCVSTQTTQNITVNPSPSSTFSVSGNVCVGTNATITYTGTAIPGATYNWNFNGGTIVSGTGAGPYQVNWANAGNQTVTLTVTGNGCTSQLTTQSLTVFPIPSSTFTLPVNVCAGANATITYNGSAGTGATYNWNFGGGTIISGSGQGPYQVSWSNPGAINVALSVTQNGCISTQTTQSITVNPIPTANFTLPTGVCIGENATINYTGTASAAATYNWNFGNGTIVSGSGQGPYTVNWPAMGNQIVSLTVAQNGCTSSAFSQTIQIYDTPSPNFTVTPAVCINEPATITYTGTGTNNGTFNWNLGGGSGTPLNGPGSFNVTFANSGNQQVSLSVSENGCSSVTNSQSITVHPIPTAAFSTSGPACVGENFTITYTGSAQVNAQYNWNFGGLTVVSGTGSGPYTISGSNAGNENITLSVTQNGCTSNTNTVSQVINPIPTSSFTFVSPVCQNQNSNLSYNGQNAAPGATYTWVIDDLTTISSTNSSASPTWNTPGTKNVTLTVVSLGCTSTPTTHQVLVNPLPQVDAGADVQTCSGIATSLGNEVSLPGAIYQWSPVTGLTNPNASQTEIIRENNTNNPVSTTYTLTVTDQNGCTANDQVVFTVVHKPVVSFSIPAGQCFEGNSFNFAAQGNFSNSAIFNWDLGPNANIQSSNLRDPSGINFNTTGPQQISVFINDNNCLSEVFTSTVSVFEEPNAAFEALNTEGCRPLQVEFINNSTGPGTLSYTWNYGNFVTSNAINPKYVYNNTGTFDVFLVAVTANGCRDTVFVDDLVKVYPNPVAIFTVNKEEVTLIDPTIRVTSLSLNADNCYYYFNSGEDYNECNFVHTFQDTGAYLLTHIVSNDFGCTDSVSRLIKVTLGYRIYIPNAFTPNNDGLNDLFMVYGDGIEDFHIMIFNRWGEMMYQSYDIESGWDGRYRIDSGPAPTGVYNYVMTIRTKEKEFFTYRGSITLVR